MNSPEVENRTRQRLHSIPSNRDPKDVEMAERIEEALTQAMDIVYDYQSMADEHKRMVEKYETEAPVIKRGMDFYCCPACGKRTSRNHTHCH